MIYNIHRIDPTNIGDMVCSPMNYFNFPTKVVFHDTPYQHHDYVDFPKDVDVIIGASGIHYAGWLSKLEKIRLRKTKGKWIIWAIGHNHHIKNNNVKPIKYPDYFNNMDLIGVRDYGTPYAWCPDPTCLHKGFDLKKEIKHEIVVYKHPNFDIPKTNFPESDNTKPFDEVLDFLKSANTILTNTYHGVYWSILLRKRVIAFPFSSKFFGFKYKIPICRDGNWTSLLNDTMIYPEALNECRKINLDFSQKVGEVLNMEITLKDNVKFPLVS